MEPTTIKTKTTKQLRDLSPGDGLAEVLIGGVEHFIESALDGAYWRVCATKSKERVSVGDHAFDLDAEVTVTEERPMTVADLEVGDCFRIAGHEGGGAFLVCLGEDYDCSRTARVLKVYAGMEGAAQEIRVIEYSEEVTLVTPTFDAEPVRESETVAVGDLGEDDLFFCGDRRGKFFGLSLGWAHVLWTPGGDIQRTADLPPKMPVTVQTDATYDSWDDVSVGDVFTREGGVACIKLSNDTWYEGGPDGGVYQASRRPIIGREFGRSVKPARLTSVSWECIPEVER